MTLPNKILFPLKIIILAIIVSLSGVLATTRLARANEIIITKVDNSSGLIQAKIKVTATSTNGIEFFKSKQLFTVYKQKLNNSMYEGYVNNIYLISQIGNTITLKEPLATWVIKPGYYLVPSNFFLQGKSNC